MFDVLPTASDSPLHQSVQYETTLNAVGADPRRLSNGLLALHRRLPGGLRVTMLPRATLPRHDRLLMALAHAGLDKNLIILAPDHSLPKGYFALPLVRPTKIAILDLFEDSDRQRGNLHQKWRNRLSHAERNRLTVSPHIQHLDWVLGRDQVQQRQRRYRGWPERLTRTWVRRNPDDYLLLTAIENRRPIAAMLFLRHGPGATYHIGYSTDRGRQVSAHNLLMWAGMTRLANIGCDSLDLGRVDTDPGLARFKRGTGAQDRALGGTWGWWPRVSNRLRG